VGVKTVGAMIEPVAGELFVVGGVAGIKGEMQDEEEAEAESGEERGEEMFVEKFVEHGCGRQ